MDTNGPGLAHRWLATRCDSGASPLEYDAETARATLETASADVNSVVALSQFNPILCRYLLFDMPDFYFNIVDILHAFILNFKVYRLIGLESIGLRIQIPNITRSKSLRSCNDEDQRENK